MTNSLERYLARVPRIDAALDRAPERPPCRAACTRPSASACRGRPSATLCLLACESAMGKSAAMPAAVALEMIHTYSLIHDDLPAMDDDDWRRGRPSCHKVYGEGMAILAGDALLALAFQTLARRPLGRARDPIRLLKTVTEATGTGGMIGGQAMDLLSEGKRVPLHDVLAMHRRKTMLIRARFSWGADRRRAAAALAGSPHGDRAGLAFRSSMTCSTSAHRGDRQGGRVDKARRRPPGERRRERAEREACGCFARLGDAPRLGRRAAEFESWRILPDGTAEADHGPSHGIDRFHASPPADGV
jgi:geranylgeranyl diphosphate synthase type II